MADTKISALPVASALGGTEPMPVVQAGATVRATPSQLRTYVLANMGTTIIVSTASTGTDTYTATSAVTQIAYVQWRLYLWKCPNANTGAATINWDGLGAKSIVKITSTALNGGDLQANVYYWLLYDGTNMLIVGSNAIF